MKKYKKILAGFLAVSLMLGSVPVTIQASSSYQDYTEDIQNVGTSDDTEVADVTEETAEAETREITEETVADTEEVVIDTEETDNDTEEAAIDTEETDNDTEEVAIDTEETDNDTEETTADTEAAIVDTEDMTTEAAESEDESSVEPATEKELEAEKVPEEKVQANDMEASEEAEKIKEYLADEVTDGTLTLQELEESPEHSANIVVSGNDITVRNESTMVLISNVRSEDLAGKNITIDATGQVDLTKEVSFNSKKYTYHSLGTEAYPFSGTLKSQTTLIFDRTIFGVIQSTAKLSIPDSSKLIWKGKDDTQSVYAIRYIFTEEKEEIVSLGLSIESDAADDGYILGNFIGTVAGKNGILTIEGLDYTSQSVSVSVNETSNAGLICNTLENGTVKLKDCSLPKKYTVASQSGHAGGLVGYMSRNTKLIIDSSLELAMTVNAEAQNQCAGGLIGQMEDQTSIQILKEMTLEEGTITSKNGNAGGLAGKMGTGDTILVGADVSLEKSKITGSEKAGGIASEGQDTIFENTNSAKLTLSSATIKETKEKVLAYVGGVFGSYLATKDQKFPDWFVMGKEAASVHLVTSSNYGKVTDVQGKGCGAGGIFGELTIQSGAEYSIDNMNLWIDKDVSDNTGKGCGYAYGAVAGIVKADTTVSSDKLAALRINPEITKQTIVDSKISASKKTYYNGGLIGYAEANLYVEVKNVNIFVKNPFANDTNSGFGGVTGSIGQNSVLKLAEQISVSTSGDSDKKIWEGGGIVGYADEGSAVEFNGTTDISKSYFTTMDKVGLLVARQNNALIYARGDGNGNGWTYIRPKRDNITDDRDSNIGDLDDIGNYGQVIRLKADQDADRGLDPELIKIDPENHKIKLNNKKLSLDKTNNKLQIPDKETFALLAIALQSEGRFNAWSSEITDYKSLYSQDMTLTGNIDLTGTGIYGLTRDERTEKVGNYDPKSYVEPYTGTFDGTGHTITLAIGELYGKRDDGVVNTAGSAGEVCRHANQGIFAKTKGATVKNLNIEGVIRVNGMAASRYTTDRKLSFYIGGFSGMVQGNLTADQVNLQENIFISAVKNIDQIYAGGLAGVVTDGDSQIDLGRNGTIKAETGLHIVSNELKGEGSSKYDCIYAGGVLGALAGGSNIITLNCNDVQLAGSVDNADGAAILPAGGLLGYSGYGSARNKITIKNIVVAEQKVTGGDATISLGGILGYKWEDVDVAFDPSENTTNYALDVTDALVSATKDTACIGGLVYHSSGKWTVEARGIRMQKATFTAANIGLLLGHMEVENNNSKSLYLEFTDNWKTAYELSETGITITANTGKFDEIAAYTAASASAIMDNAKNGIISLETEDAKGVDIDSACNTYENRTQHGKSHQINDCSRYYYNLASMKQNSKFGTSGNADTPERLLAWSIWHYVPENLKNIIFGGCGFTNNTVIGGSGTKKAELDLKGLSYYPVNVNGVTVSNAVVTFYNSEIEACENKNKTTIKSSGKASQHHMMHCGLFYNMGGNTATDIITTVKNVTFAGTIGWMNDGSGALCRGTISDNEDTGKGTYKLTLDNIILDGLSVANCKNNYAPLLINKTNGYTAFSISNVSATESYASGTAVGSSLIGRVGTKKATQITMSFHKMILPDKTITDGGIFTHATFLESYQYSSTGVASAVYTFNKEEDWNGETFIHNVTYGKEITESIEYDGLQTHYYNKETYTSEDGLVKDQDGSHSFETYLPYVKDGYVTSELKHEIKVNQRINDLLEGCGTYGHPYIFRSALDFSTVAEYMATKEAKQDWKIKVTVDQTELHTDESSDADSDVVYKYDTASTMWQEVEDQSNDSNPDNWVVKTNGKQLSNDIMLRYILNAYYDVQTDTTADETIKIKDFSGFGTEDTPFRGVITSTQKPKKATIELTGASRDLISYSYGSVIKDLNIVYSGTGFTVTKSENTTKEVTYQPKEFWGGVIGCILGGDNIIDNVSVTMQNDWKLTLNGAKKHLIQAGGYVGSVAGGGVIFRNMTGKTGLSKTDPASNGYLYVNPFVGRVLDGYAFSEDCKIDNGVVCPVNLLNSDKTGEITTTGSESAYTTQIDSAQGLLVFSAIVNSGAASGAAESDKGTLAYYGENYSGNRNELSFGNGDYGKVRNAAYSYIGTSGETAESDFAISLSDDRKHPGCANKTTEDLNTATNAPYLVSKYANGTTFYVCSRNADLAINLKTSGTYDMTQYGNGYQGISVRYISNALNTGESVQTTWDYSYGIPKLSGFNGNGAVVLVKMEMKEYTDDDFPGASFGGVFNLIRAVDADQCGNESDRSLVQNLQMKNSKLQLQYVKEDGTFFEPDKATEKIQIWTNADKEAYKLCVSVGGFAGNTVQNGIAGNNKENSSKINYKVSRFRITDSTIIGPYSAGGFMGATGMGNNGDTSYTGIGRLFMVNSTSNGWNSYGLKLENCTYDNLTVTGGCVAGGLVGFAASSSRDFAVQERAATSSLTITDSAYSVAGQNSTITTSWLLVSQTDDTNNTKSDKFDNEAGISSAGGIFGRTGVKLQVLDEVSKEKVVFKNLKISSKRDAGAAVGYAGGNECSLYNISVNQTNTESSIEGDRHAGGVVGSISTNKTVLIDNCTADDVTITGGYNGAAGILGGFENCYDSVQKVQHCNVSRVTVTAIKNHCAVGGLIGNVKGNGQKAQFVVEDCSVKSSTVGDVGRTEWNGGLVGSMSNNNNQYLYIYDTVVADTTVNIASGSNGGAGGLTCAANGTLYCSNILLDNVDLKGSNVAAFIYDSGNAKTVCADGISIQNCNKANVVGESKKDNFKFGTSSYIAFADYTYKAKTVSASATDLLGVDQAVSPYVVTSPKSTLAVTDGETKKFLHSDGAAWTGTGKNSITTAQTIWTEKDNTTTDGRFYYKDTNVDSFDFSTNLSSYNSNQKAEDGLNVDFPVLVITGGNTECIADYLDILTNGGYRNAVSSNSTNAEHVTAVADVYDYDKTKNTFVKNNSADCALSVVANGTANMAYKASKNYDNDRNRFTLLTVTWKSQINDIEHKYSIQIPVIVKRIMDIDFVATLGYGTRFRSTDYDTLTGHVLDSFGNPITGYLTYIYNSAKGTSVEYGWNSYIEGGGIMTGAVDKKLLFSTGLPVGTQLTLVDCQDPNRTAYYYTTSDRSENSIAMSSFVRSDNKTPFYNENIGEALGAKVQASENGAFIEVDVEGAPIEAEETSVQPLAPTVELDGKYYRLAETGEESYPHFSITVDEKNTKENYYLVITMPKTEEMPTVNGWLGTELQVSVPHNRYYMLRDLKTIDSHSDTASTYQISNGYEQSLIETLEGTVSSKALNTSDSVINVSVRDEITFPNDQVYNAKDQLYQRFVGNLQTFVQDKISYEQFPSGTSGKVRFYVYTLDDEGVPTYYTYSTDTKLWGDGQSTKKQATEYTWISTGGNMELPLSTDGTLENAISLQGLRDKVKKSSDKGTTSTFYVEAVLDAVIPSTGLNVIPVSTLVNGVPQNYAKLNYIAQISTEKTSLTYSSTKATLTNTKVSYYQEDLSGMKLTYEADDIDQLGINLLDLSSNLDKDQKNAIIGTTARLDLSAMQNLENVLRNSGGVRFKLTLSKKSETDTEAYDTFLSDADNYMRVELASPDSGTVAYQNGTWTWTIPVTTYLEDDKLKTGTVFDGSSFNQAVNLFVDVESVEKNTHLYSNYKVELTAEVLTKEGYVELADTDNIIYTITKINPQFTEKNNN